MNYLKYIRHPRTQRTLLALSLKKILQRFLYVVPKESFFDASDVDSILYNFETLEKSVMCDCKLEHLKL